MTRHQNKYSRNNKYKNQPVILNNVYKTTGSNYYGNYRYNNKRKNNSFSNSHEVVLDSQVQNNKKPDKQSFSFIDQIKNSKAFCASFENQSFLSKIIILLWRIFTVIFILLLRLLKSLIKIISYLCKRFKFAKYLFIVLSFFLLYLLVDTILFGSKIYPGVHVGEVDVGNMNIEQASDLINDTYLNRLESREVIIYANEQAQNEGISENSGSGITEQLSLDQAKQTVKYWKTNYIELDATLPSMKLAQDAYDAMRGPFSIFQKIGTIFVSYKIDPYVNYSDDALKTYINKINDTIGSPVVNPTVVIEDVKAHAVNGEDGNLISNTEFETQLNTSFLSSDIEQTSFVAHLYPAYQQITYSCANELASKINNSLNCGANFTYKQLSWTCSAAELSGLIDINVFDNQNSKSEGCSCTNFDTNFCIAASMKTKETSQHIYSHTKQYLNNDANLNVTFNYDDDNNIVVNTDNSVEMPTASTAIATLNNDWLKNPISFTNNASGRSSGCVKPNEDNINIIIEPTQIPSTMNFDDALSLGLIGEISSYVTTYSSGAGSENRNFNIDLVSSKLNDSICKANGSTWSFNEIAGECNVESGFKEAGTVVGSTYTKEAGGGICQVATTIFNAVFEGGYPVVERSNHDLHIASYAAGRDAAISWPKPDFRWKNDTSSDILVKIESTGYSVCATLYGISQNYRVTSEESPWTEGEKYTTTVVVDPSKAPNSSYIQVSGSDGKSITVKRQVYDSNNNLIREDEFKSNYKPKTEIKVIGPGEEANKLLASGEARLKKDSDNW